MKQLTEIQNHKISNIGGILHKCNPSKMLNRKSCVSFLWYIADSTQVKVILC